MDDRLAYLTPVLSHKGSNFLSHSPGQDGPNSSVHQDTGMTDASTLESPFVAPPYSQDSPYLQKSYQNTQPPPLNDNYHHAQPGIDWTNAPWSSPHATTFNSRVHPASSIEASATHCDPTSFSGTHNAALASSNPTQKLHGDHFDDVGCFQNTPLHLSSATAASTISSMVQSNMGYHQLIWHWTPPSLPLDLLHSSSTAPYPMGLTFPPTVEFPFYPPMATHLLPPSDLLSANEESSTSLDNHPPAHLPPRQSDLPEPHESSPSSTNPPGNSQLQASKARRERVAHDLSTSASDRRVTSPRFCPYRRPQKKRPAVDFEPDVKKLQHRCKEGGAEEQAVLLIEKVFVDKVDMSSLTRRMSAKEFGSREFGGELGQVYVGFLRAERNARYTCRLCPTGTEMSWKHRRDVLRHLRREHFGLADKCDDCGKLAYTTGEMSGHRCRKQN